MKSIGDVLHETGWPQRLRDLASRIEANVPSHRNPESFHTEKSEIADDLRKLARSLDSR